MFIFPHAALSQTETLVLLVGVTWTDALMQAILELTIKQTRSELADKLDHLLETELYDSDALRMDVCVQENIMSNVGHFVGDAMFLQCRQLCRRAACMSLTLCPCLVILMNNVL